MTATMPAMSAHRSPAAIFFAAALFAAIGALPAAAQNHWGAVAASPGGAAAQAIEQPSRDAARTAAVKNCQDRCSYIVTFYRACAAIATGGTGGYGWAAGSSVEETGERALRFCAQRNKDCQLRIVACSGND